MNVKSASGLTLVELIVVVGIAVVLVMALCPVTVNDSLLDSMAAVGMRGRDIFVAIEGANTERKALGLPPVWPCDFDPATVTNAEERALMGASNSSDFFRMLYDEERLGASDWAPYVAGFDYAKLAGAGVPANMCGQGLRATNNMWTVAKNVRDDMDDVIPVLITRNIDASSLAARAGDRDLAERSLRFDSAWTTPFGRKGYVLIRKGGAMFKARPKYMPWRVVYNNQAFDTALTTNGAAVPLLKYLTPDREVVPGS